MTQLLLIKTRHRYFSMQIIIGLSFCLFGCSQNSKFDQTKITSSHNSPDISIEIDIPDTIVPYGEKFKAKFKVIDSRAPYKKWLVNISYPLFGDLSGIDTVRFIQLTRVDSVGMYLADITIQRPETYRFFVMAECCEGQLGTELIYFEDTLQFQYLPPPQIEN